MKLLIRLSIVIENHKNPRNLKKKSNLQCLQAYSSCQSSEHTSSIAMVHIHQKDQMKIIRNRKQTICVSSKTIYIRVEMHFNVSKPFYMSFFTTLFFGFKHSLCGLMLHCYAYPIARSQYWKIWSGYCISHSKHETFV